MIICLSLSRSRMCSHTATATQPDLTCMLSCTSAVAVVLRVCASVLLPGCALPASLLPRCCCLCLPLSRTLTSPSLSPFLRAVQGQGHGRGGECLCGGVSCKRAVCRVQAAFSSLVSQGRSLSPLSLPAQRACAVTCAPAPHLLSVGACKGGAGAHLTAHSNSRRPHKMIRVLPAPQKHTRAVFD